MRRDCLGRRQEKQWEARFPGSRGGTGEDRDQLSRAWTAVVTGKGAKRASGREGWVGSWVGSLRPAAPYVSVARLVCREVTSENVFLDSDLSTF